MPLVRLARAVSAVRRLHRRPSSRDGSDLDGTPADRIEAAQLVRTVVTMQSSLDRALVLAAIRHELRLPLGAASVPAGALHLERADDSSVVVASAGRNGSRFCGTCTVHDTSGGSTAVWRTTAFHQRGERTSGVEQLRTLLGSIEHAVLAADPDAQIERRVAESTR